MNRRQAKQIVCAKLLDAFGTEFITDCLLSGRFFPEEEVTDIDRYRIEDAARDMRRELIRRKGEFL